MEPIEIRQIASRTIVVPIIGTSPLIVHNFGAKARRQMLDGMQGKKSPKEHRDPQAEYLASMYRMALPEGGEAHGFPVVGFKAATVGAARFYGGAVKMTELRQFLFMRGQLTKADPQQLVRIEGEPQMREDVVRISMGKTDLRYRAEFPEWRAELTVTYVKTGLSQSSVLSLIDAGGLGVGVGEWRPERRGEFGTYQIDLDREVQVIAES